MPRAKSLDAPGSPRNVHGQSYREWQRDWPNEATATAPARQTANGGPGAKSSFDAKASGADEM